MGTLKVNGVVPKIACNKPLKKINVNGATVWEGTPDSIIAHQNGVSTNSEWVTGVMEKQLVQSSTILGEQSKTVNTPFTLTSKAKSTYSTCTVVVGYGIGGDYGFAHVKHNGSDILTSNGSGTKTYTIGTSDTFGSLSVDAEGTVDYTAKWAEVWIESITLSGKK